MKLSILIPCFNEERTIKVLLEKVIENLNQNDEIIIIDDFSTDKTRNILRNQFENSVYKIIYNEKNYGKGFSIRQGIKAATGEIILIQDADLEYDPNDYQFLLDKIKDGGSEVVYGSRVLNKKRYKNNFISNYRILGNHLLTMFSNLINKQKLTDAHSCYKLFSADLFKNIKLEHNDFSFCPEITTKISNLKKNIIEVPISYRGRSIEEGKKIRLKDAFYAIYTLIKFKYFVK